MTYVPHRRSMLAFAKIVPAFLALATMIVAPVALGAGTAGASVPPFATVSAVVCPSKSDCLASGEASYNPSNFSSTAGVVYSTDAGSKWAVGKVPSGYSGIFGITCVSTSTCYAVAASATGSGALLSSTNADSKTGPTWKTHSLPKILGEPFTSPNSVSCPSNSLCYVAGTSKEGSDPSVAEVSISKSGSIKLSAVKLPTMSAGQDYPGVLRSISCSSTTTCLAVGWNSGNRGGGFALIEGHWSLLTSFKTSVYSLFGVDCVAKSSDCYAAVASLSTSKVGGILESTNDGSSWKTQSIPSGTLAVYGISCTTTSQCAATGTGSNGYGQIETKTSGSKFSAAKTPSVADPMYAITCESSTFCVSGGSNTEGTAAEIIRTTTFTSYSYGTIG
ncbi:MAG: hypothetical protein ACLQK4_02320 [Acidimicrobiales bacterium]|jgi:hypothetical protein